MPDADDIPLMQADAEAQAAAAAAPPAEEHDEEHDLSEAVLGTAPPTDSFAHGAPTPSLGNDAWDSLDHPPPPPPLPQLAAQSLARPLQPADQAEGRQLSGSPGLPQGQPAAQGGPAKPTSWRGAVTGEISAEPSPREQAASAVAAALKEPMQVGLRPCDVYDSTDSGDVRENSAACHPGLQAAAKVACLCPVCAVFLLQLLKRVQHAVCWWSADGQACTRWLMLVLCSCRHLPTGQHVQTDAQGNAHRKIADEKVCTCNFVCVLWCTTAIRMPSFQSSACQDYPSTLQHLCSCMIGPLGLCCTPDRSI